MRPVCGIQGTWPRASTAPPIPSLPCPSPTWVRLPLSPPPSPYHEWWQVVQPHQHLWTLKSMCLCVCTLHRQVSVILFGLCSWAPVTVPMAAKLANVTGLAEVRRRLSFNHWSLRTTHLIRLDLRFTAARVTQPNPGVNHLITDPCVLHLCHHQGQGEGGVRREEREKRERILT